MRMMASRGLHDAFSKPNDSPGVKGGARAPPLEPCDPDASSSIRSGRPVFSSTDMSLHLGGARGEAERGAGGVH